MAPADLQAEHIDADDFDITKTLDLGSEAMGLRAARQSTATRMANQLPGRNTADDRVRWGRDTRLLNQVQLSTYPDCIGGNLATLEGFIANHLSGVVGGVHVLPFYPSSADRGFAPLTYKQVSSEFGSWESIQQIAEQGDLCVDFMVNHISAQSEQFLDFVAKGDESEWADLFIRYQKFWGGEPSQEELDLIYTRKPRPPFREVELPDGSVEKVWCTFDTEQIDIDVFSPIGADFIKDQLYALTDKGVNLIRLDAFGYTTKKRGTNCFFVEPEVWELLDRVKATLADRDTELLCEVHEHYTMQKRLAENGFWVYDFALPMLTLQALYDGDANNLKAWLLKCPRNQITTLDTHDGIGVVDVADLMTQEQIDRTKDNIFKRGANANMRYNSAQYGNLDIYQVNCSYYSAVGNHDEWYLLARAIQFFTPGVPLVYYVGLLAGANDVDLVEATKNGRDINRHGYDLEEAIAETERPVVRILFELCRFRNAHPAFNGTFSLLDTISDIREAVLFVPSEPATPAAADGDAPLAQGLPASFESQDAMVEEGGGRFRAQAVAGAHGGEDSGGQNFMTDVVGASIDILDSIDQLDEHGDWKLDEVLDSASDADAAEAAAGATAGKDAPEEATDGSDASSSTGARLSSDEPPSTAPTSSRGSIEERLDAAAAAGPRGGRRFGWSHDEHRRGRVWSGAEAGHDRIGDAITAISDADRPFQPYSAALCNTLDDTPLLTPDALASGDNFSPLQQVRRLREARRRHHAHDLPRSVLVAKWSHGDSWAVLEANLQTKDFRILYVDPYDGHQKIWNVSRTYEAYLEQARRAAEGGGEEA